MMKLNDCSATFNMVVEQTMQYYRHNKTQILCGGDIDKRFFPACAKMYKLGSKG